MGILTTGKPGIWQTKNGLRFPGFCFQRAPGAHVSMGFSPLPLASSLYYWRSIV